MTYQKTRIGTLNSNNISKILEIELKGSKKAVKLWIYKKFTVFRLQIKQFLIFLKKSFYERKKKQDKLYQTNFVFFLKNKNICFDLT